ncbi:MAG: hypothetical protein AAFQ68_16685 [Bacteroidota bacterium]
MKLQTTKGLGLLCLLLLSLSACNSFNLFDRQPQWELLRVPEAGTVHDIAGDIEETLVVGGLDKIFLTEDQGESWQIVMEDVTTRRFEMRGDSLYVFSLGDGTFYSLDMGQTWTESNEALIDEFRFEVSLSNGDRYRWVADVTFPKEPDLIERTTDGTNWENVFPFMRYVYSLYADDQDRVYVGTSGWDWNEEKGGFVVVPGRSDGLVYYVK